MDAVMALINVMTDPLNIGMLLLGTVFGGLFGLLPGITVTTALSLLIPITFTMKLIPAVLLMIGTYCSGIFGGSMTSILFKIPGDPQNAATIFDGYPMMKKGEAGKAIGAAVMASVIGGLISALILIFFSPFLMRVSLSFGPCEFFGLIFLSLSMVAILNSKDFLKGVIAVLVGMLLGTVGLSPESGLPRLTFGYDGLMSGIPFIPVLLGIFAISEILYRIETGGIKEEHTIGDPSKINIDFLTLGKWFEMKWLIMRSSLLGALFGALPGLGATLASFFSYNIEKSLSKKKDEWGKGIVEGVVCCETANNATTGSGMMLLISLGIPGTIACSVILITFELHGVNIGAFFFLKEKDVLYAIFAGFIMANLLIIPFAYLQLKTLVPLLNMPFKLFAPIIMAFCVVGAFAANNNFFDILIMFVAGIVGYFMVKYDYPIAVLVLGNILGPLAEEAYSRAYLIKESLFSLSMNSYISSISIFLGLLLWVSAIIFQIVQRRKMLLR